LALSDLVALKQHEDLTLAMRITFGSAHHTNRLT